jgi:predicted nucleotidyltransferase
MVLKNDYIAIAKKIVLKQLGTKQFKVFLFGSRAYGNARFNSDIDIGLWGSCRVPVKLKIAIEDALEESVVPFNVDIVDFSLVDDTFKKFALEKIVEWT